MNYQDQALRDRYRKKNNLLHMPCVVGDGNAPSQIVDPAIPGNIFVRFIVSGNYTPPVSVGAPLGKMNLAPGQAVKLAYDDFGKLFIAGYDTQGTLVGGGAPIANVIDTAKVAQQDFATLLPQPTQPASTIINVKGWQPILDNVYTEFPGSSIDLGAGGENIIPGAGDQAWIVIALDSDFATLVAVSSTVVELSDSLDREDSIQECLDQLSQFATPIWAMLLSDDQTEISQNDFDLGVDLRQAINNAEGGSTSGDVSGPGSSTDRAIATWNGTDGRTLRDNPFATIDSSGNITNISNRISGTGGNGFIQLVSQSSAPSAPADGIRIYADASDRLSWIKQGDSFPFTLAGTPTAARVQTLQDASGTIALTNATGQGFVMTAPTTTADNTIAAATTTTALLTLQSTDDSITNNLLSGKFSSGTTFFSAKVPTAANCRVVIVNPAIADVSVGLGVLTVNPTFTYTANNAISPIGAFINPTFNTSGFSITGSVTGYNATINVSGGSTLSNAIPASIGFSISGTSSVVSQVRMILATSATTAAGGAITSLAAFASNAQTGATNNTYLLLGTSTIPTGNWTIHATTTNDSAIAGSLTLGATTAPGARLQVNAAASGIGLIVRANATTPGNLTEWQTSAGTLRFAIGAEQVASAAGATLRSLYGAAQTITITGSTNITTATGFNLVEFGQPTLSAASALTVTNSATLYIANAPTGGGAGPAAITNAYALWVDAGTSRFDGNVGIGLAAPTTSLDITRSVSDPASSIPGELIVNTVTLTADNAVNGVAIGLTADIRINQGAFNATGSTFPVRSVQGVIRIQGSSGTVSQAVGLFAVITNTGAGTVTDVMGFSNNTVANTGGGVITNNYGFHTPNQTVGTNIYGFYGNIAAASGRWNLYMNGTANNAMAGPLTVGAASVPTGTLDVITTTGGILTLSRNDTSITAADVMGTIQFWGNDTSLTTQNIFANIEVQSTATVSTDAAAGRMIFRTTSTTAGGSPIEAMRISAAQLVGINTGADASARLHVIESTLGNAVQTLSSTATNDDPTEIVYQNRAATTDATVTTLHTFTVPATTTYAIEARVTARRTGGTAGTAEDGADYIIVGTYKNVAGTATVIGGPTTLYSAEDQAGWNATLDVTGATVRVRVTGATDNNVTWHMTARVYQVST